MEPENPTNKPNPLLRDPSEPAPKPSNDGGRPQRGRGGDKPRGGGRGNGNGQSKDGQKQQNGLGGNLSVSRGQAVRALKRTQMDAQRIANQYQTAKAPTKKRANVIDDSPVVKFIGLGGMDGGGSKNMLVLEYLNDAIIMDCGNDLGVDLPGINYGIADTAYLETIRHKLRGYVITHGHLDHIGGLPHIVPNFPAPIYGSKFTIGRVEEIFSNFGLPMPDGFELNVVTMNENTHERLKVGAFFIELVRVTHSIPGSTIVVVDTPVGRFVNTGDFRLDPNPLDHERTDVERLKELGDEGVLALLSESTTTERPGRTPSESEIEDTFHEIMKNAPGRVFIGLFSTNMNRVQMIINAAVSHNKKVAMDGRSMVSTLEMAVRHGFVRIPKGTFVPIANASNMNDQDLVVVCTGSQGEPSSAMQRMSNGEHRHVKLKEQDTVVLSSSPIPYSGNDAKIRSMVDDLHKKGVHVFQHITRDLYEHGPLHVSGHASIEEYRDMINFTKPKFFLPIYGDFTSKRAHINIALEEGIPRANTMNIENGVVLGFTEDSMTEMGEVPHGTVLVDQTGATVSNVVVKDRVLLAEEGLVSIVLTIDKKSGNLLTSPDIISRGFIYMRENEEVMNGLRIELKRAVQQRFKRVDLDRFKAELKDHITHYLFEQTQRSPIVIPVVNVIGGKPDGAKTVHQSKTKSAEEVAQDQQKRFQEMRARLLGQDQQD